MTSIHSHIVDRLLAEALTSRWSGQTIPGARNRATTRAITEPDRAVSLVFTYDSGYHASGWWANSQYDKCFHLSVAFVGEGTELVTVSGQSMMRQKLETATDAEVKAWAKAFFGGSYRMSWTEPAASPLDPHQLPNVVHVRLWLDEHGNPFQPTGEVYNLVPTETSPAKILDGRLGADVR